jgi:hypothetical protein
MAENNQGIGGITFTGNITVNGPMFDIHDNQHVHIHTNGQGKENREENVQSPSIELLRRLVGEADASKPKQVLMPYKAALSISAVPRWDYSTFNRLMGTNVTRNSFSNWINETQGCTYTDEEIDPIVEQFKKLT